MAKNKTFKMSTTSDEKGRGSCCSLEAVKHFLQSGTIPEGYTKNDKRALRRRARSFVLIKDELYFTGGRSRHNKGLIEVEKDGVENPENEPDHTQVLRKVLFSAEEQQQAVDRAHVAEDGTHFGMEKTKEQVSSQYYWMGITYSVRNTIHTCLNCSSRSKTIGPTFSFNTSGSKTNTSVSAATMATKHSAVVWEGGDEAVIDGGESTDVGDLNEGVDGTSDLTAMTAPALVKQELEKQAADVFFVAKDICSYFWQKVEIQMFGPYQAGKKQVYVAIALDSYSQFPEATIMEVLSSATLTNFVLNLFCRYGAMEKLSLLQNQVTKNKEFLINTQDMLQAGISPTLLLPHVNPLDERWRHVEKSLHRFVSLYPEFWYHCLEAFMVPLRVTLPPEADYSPYYLVHGREPPMPDKLGMNRNSDMSVTSEVQLTEDQERQTVEMITTAYGVYSENPSIPATLPEPPTAANLVPAPGVVHNGAETSEKSWATGKGRWGPRQRRGRPGLKETGKLGTEGEEVEKERDKEGGKPVEVEDSPGVHHDSDHDVQCHSDEEDDSDRDATYEPEIRSVGKRRRTEQQPTRTSTRQRRSTYKAQESGIVPKKGKAQESSTQKAQSSSKRKALASRSEKMPASVRVGSRVNTLNASKKQRAKGVTLPVGDTPSSVVFKKKRGRPCKNATDDIAEGRHLTKVKKTLCGPNVSVIRNMKQLPLDTFYFIIKQYKEHGLFPPGVSGDTRQSIQRLCQMVQAKDGKLYSNAGRSAGRLIITTEKARFSILRKAHARGEEHHGRISVLKYLSDIKVFWKGMSLDLDAFIHGCPECVCKSPLHSSTLVQIPSKSAVLTAQEREEEDPHLSEDEEEESSYEDLIQYLTDNTFPSTATPYQQLRIKQQSESFCIVSGSLHYSKHRKRPAGAEASEPLQVLFSESLRHAAIRDAHIEEGNHLSEQDTQAKLRRKYFWYGMTFDVMSHIMGCCMEESLAALPVPHRNPIIQERVDKFRSYYKKRMIPKLDTSLITGLEVNAGRGEAEEESITAPGEKETDGEADMSQSSQTGIKQPLSVAGKARVNREVDKDVVQVVETIISMQQENDNQGSVGLSPFGNVRSRKDAHKCQHCGKFISGHVAYRVHLYKHTGVKPFSCSTCGKSFTTSKSLQVHTRKHTGVKPYLCNQCGREFFRSTSFKYHLKTHSKTKLKPLPCDKCSREFLTQNRLDKHKEFKHPAVPKVYMCKHCGKVFTAARSLKWHEQSHSNPRKYECELCCKEFTRKEYLATHMAGTHSEEFKMTSKQHAQVQQQQAQEQLQQEHQQQLLPHILQHHGQADQLHLHQPQLLQNIDIPVTSNISVIQWSEEEHQQAASHIAISEHGASHITISDHAGNSIPNDGSGGITISDHQIVTDLETYQAHTRTLPQSGHTTVHILTQAQLPLTAPSLSHHLPVTTTAPGLQSLHHTLQHAPPEVLLQQEAVPVQYEVECLSGEPSGLTEADLNAVHMLAQASLGGQNILH